MQLILKHVQWQAPNKHRRLHFTLGLRCSRLSSGRASRNLIRSGILRRCLRLWQVGLWLLLLLCSLLASLRVSPSASYNPNPQHLSLKQNLSVQTLANQESFPCPSKLPEYCNNA